MMLLQIDPGAASNNLLQYGAIGGICVLLIAALIFIFNILIKQIEKRLEQTQKDLDVERSARLLLQTKFDEYVSEDRQKAMLLMEEIRRVLTKVDAKL